MNKPDWKNAPSWAKYLAMDEDKSWWWYEEAPYEEYGRWCSIGRSECASNETRWYSSLEERPKT
jgi:hypothetical protein